MVGLLEALVKLGMLVLVGALAGLAVQRRGVRQETAASA
jgi:hypothetical protein